MTCAKCGMSIDANAGEKQERVRRPKEKPEVEIDPTLPAKPSTFPFALAITIALIVVGGIVFVAYQVKLRGAGEITDEQRENLRALDSMQKAFLQLWDANLAAHDAPSCQMLVEIVRKPCRPTVKPSELAFDEAVLAIGQADTTRTCISAVEAFSKSRFDAKCD